MASGRKRQIAVDMMGLLAGVAVTAASADDGNAASEVLWQRDDAVKFPRLEVVKDYERTPRSSEAWVRISSIGGMLRRLAPDGKRVEVPFRYPRNEAA